MLMDCLLQIAAAYGVYGPYHGASAALPIWKVQVEPNEFSKNYLLIASPHNRIFPPIIGLDPPDIKNQIAVGMAVSAHIVNWTLIIFHVISKHYHVTVVVILLGGGTTNIDMVAGLPFSFGRRQS